MTQPFFSALRGMRSASSGLPGNFITLVLLVVVTQLSALLMNQPAAYWLDAQYASTNLPLRFLFIGGPWVYSAGAVLYLILISLLLKKLNVGPAFFLASCLLFFHAVLLFWSAMCGWVPVFELSSAIGCVSFRDGMLVGVAVLAFVILFVRLPERLARWVTRVSVTLIVLWIALLGYGLVRAARPPASAWQALAPAHSPGPRAFSAVAYDTKRQRAVLFGGVVDWWGGNESMYDASTWEWDGQDWHEMKTDVAPPGRYLHSMAYDETHGTVILYGGWNQNGALADLWEWDGVKWHQLCPACNPAARMSHRMFYDFHRERIVAYGGYNKGKNYAEAWSWDGSAWSYFPFSTSAPTLLRSPLVYDEANQRVIAHIKSADWSGTWIWQGDTWRKLKLDVQPAPRSDSTLVYDPLNAKTILFGGGDDNSGWFNDTWVFDGETWTELQTPLAPPQRYGAVAFYDKVRHSMIVYGGQKTYTVYADMWELTLPGGK